MELIKELNENNNNESVSVNSINVTTARIKEILEETPTATGVVVEHVKPSQELAPKKPQFLQRTLTDFPKGL